MSSPLPFKGIIPPLVTPLTNDDHLDVDGLDRMIEHLLAGGVHGLFILGTTGEAPSLSESLKREVIQRTVTRVASRVPVLVGVTDTSLSDARALARSASEAGADAVVMAPPYYFPARQQDLRACFQQFAEECPLPLVLYNIPSHTKVAIDVPTVRQLMDVPNIVGLKESSGDMLYFGRLVQLLHERPDFTLLIGPEELLAEAVLMGAHGGICGGANITPALYVELFEAALTGDLRLVHKLQQRVMRLSERIYRVGEPPTSYLTGLKCALACLGLCSDRLAAPLQGLSPEQRMRIEQHLRDLQLLSADPQRVS